MNYRGVTNPLYCFTCTTVKEPDDFYYLKSHPTRPHKPCKQCHAAKARRRRKQPTTRARYIKRSRAYYEDNREREKQKGRARDYRKKPRDPFKETARTALHNAVQSGAIVKPAHCEDCKQEFSTRLLHGHHSDYSKPLDVAWLCSTCHGARHRLQIESLTLDQVEKKQ